MAITLEANYSKKIGLPGYSSHQYMLTVRAELSDITQVGPESQRLHALLQASVDRELQQPGWLPEPKPANGNGRPAATNGNGHPPRNGTTQLPAERWACSPKQQALILKIVEEHQLDKNAIEQLAQDRFGTGVKQLKTLEASGLIEELMAKHPRQRANGHAPQRSNYAVR